ncbi:hypothetical protein Tco_1154768 [Tanacetum coccineum]
MTPTLLWKSISEPTNKKTSSKRRVKKKVTLSADDNIISDDLDSALELAKSISQSEAEEAEAARKSGGRSSKSVAIQNTLSTPKSKPTTSKTKFKGDQSLIPQEQEAADIMQALKEVRRQLEDNRVLKAQMKELGDEQDSEFSDDDNDDVEKDDKDGDADDEGKDHINEDVEMKDAEVEESDKGEEKVTNAAKEEAKKTSEAKDDAKKIELPPSSSSLSVSSGFGDKFLKLSSDSSLVSTVKDSADTNVSSLLDIPIQ